jgi:flagellin
MKIGGTSLSTNKMTQVREQQQESMKRLATGLKINSAKDDAAGMQIANRLMSQSSGIQVAMRNANDAYSLASVADSALSGINGAADRISELSLRAANASLSSADRSAIQQEITQLQQQVGDIQNNTTFAGQQLFNQSSNSQFQVGPNANTTIGLSLPDIGEQVSSLSTIDVTTQAGAQAGIETSRQVGEQVNSIRGQIGAFQNRVESTVNNLANVYEQNESARSRIQDTDFAKATADNAQNSILGQVGIAMQAQANVSRGQALSLLS